MERRGLQTWSHKVPSRLDVTEGSRFIPVNCNDSHHRRIQRYSSSIQGLLPKRVFGPFRLQRYDVYRLRSRSRRYRRWWCDVHQLVAAQLKKIFSGVEGLKKGFDNASAVTALKYPNTRWLLRKPTLYHIFSVIIELRS